VVANGGTCTSNGQCASGTCGSNGKCGGAQLEACGAGSQCQSGVCDARDSLCGLANGTSGCTEATAALVCRGGVCVNGTCGLANGATCGGDAQCASGFCSTARTCAPVGTNPPPTVRGGTGCSTSGGEMGLFGLLALAGLALRRRQGTRFARRAAAASAALLASAALGQTALVHGFAAQAYEPSYAGDSFFAAPQATVQGHLLPSAKATLNYGYQPVRILDASGQLIPQGVVVRDQLYLHLDFSLALIDRLRIDVGLPMAVAQTGDVQAAGTAAVQGGHLGDMRVGLRGSLLGGPTDAFAFGLQGDLILPTGAPSDFTGAGGVRGHVRALASGNLGGRFIYGGALGVMLASHRDLGLGDTGSSLTYAAGAAFLFADGAVQLGPELYGSTVLASGTSPLEAVLGLKYRWRSLVFGAAAGGGLTGAASAASFRGLLSVAWEPLPEPPVKAVECPAPVVQVADASTSRDSDKDGIPDSADACQFEAGVASAEPSRNGCPLDTDGDGLADAVDACPAEPGLKANKGCPPPPDRDHDGVADAEDVCPDVRGEASAAKKGCPVEEAELKEARIELAERVQFEQGKATLLPQSEEVLRGVAKVMKEHPELARLSIEGYTDNVGPADFNKVLSADRAASVLEWLVKNGGVDRRRMTSTGFGIEKPLASNDDEAGRQRNRRVEVRVLEYKAR
jgi:MYXO-CTERM domain-containing protein